MRLILRTLLTLVATFAVLGGGVAFAVVCIDPTPPPPPANDVYPCTPTTVTASMVSTTTTTNHPPSGGGTGSHCTPECPSASTSSSYSTSTYGGTTKTCKPPSVDTDCASWTDSDTAKVSGSINPNGATTSYYFEYGKTTSFGSQTPTGTAGNGRTLVDVSATIDGLTSNTTYYYRLVATNEKGTTRTYTQSFKTTAAKPTATTGSASAITKTGAAIAGTANPNGGTTSAYLEYGKTTAFGSKTTTQSLGNGTTVKSVTATLAALTANTKYYFRIVATSTAGTVTGATASFTTLPNAPTATTGAASAITKATATLGGTVNAAGSATTGYFEYGKTTAFGTKTGTLTLGSATTNQAASSAISGLTASTKYFFRFVATNAGGTTTGATSSFTTPAH